MGPTSLNFDPDLINKSVGATNTTNNSNPNPNINPRQSSGIKNSQSHQK